MSHYADCRQIQSNYLFLDLYTYKNSNENLFVQQIIILIVDTAVSYGTSATISEVAIRK